MITLGEFIRNGKAEDEMLVDFQLGLYPKENDMLEKFCGKHKLSKSNAARYFCTLGMQAHRKRSRMKKEYGDDAERQMLREDILAEFERRLELVI